MYDVSYRTTMTMVNFNYKQVSVIFLYSKTVDSVNFSHVKLLKLHKAELYFNRRDLTCKCTVHKKIYPEYLKQKKR